MSQQQGQKEGERQERGHALPKSERGTFIERLRPADRKRGTRGSRLHLHGKFVHVAKTFGGIDCNGSPECTLEPGRKVWAESAVGRSRRGGPVALGLP